MLFMIFAIFMLWAIFWTFPFDAETPLKIYFEQTIQLDGAISAVSLPHHSRHIIQDGSITSGTIRNAVTSLYGIPEYLRDIVPELPSAQGKHVDCFKSHSKSGLLGCSWPSGSAMMPQPGSASKMPEPDIPLNSSSVDTLDQADFFRAEVTRTSRTSAELTVQGKNTRNCRLYFENRPIVRYTVDGAVQGMQRNYGVNENGVKEVRLWSRDWNKTFVVNVEWRDYTGLGEGLKGRVACEWAEYASASAGVPGQGENPTKGGFRSAKIPALEELLSFLPTWVVVSKNMDGLVEAWESFEV
jgi:hypothetical protein